MKILNIITKFKQLEPMDAIAYCIGALLFVLIIVALIQEYKDEKRRY